MMRRKGAYRMSMNNSREVFTFKTKSEALIRLRWMFSGNSLVGNMPVE